MENMQNILIVDDVQTDRDLVGKVVSGAGHQPVYASDGDQALNAAKQFRPALVFMDVVMPRMNGFNACRVLKGDPDTASIPVVLVTSKGSDSDRYWGQKQGADDHVAKPFTPETLLRIIRKYVG
jgi:twitching motility two-component system response regulator PilH